MVILVTLTVAALSFYLKQLLCFQTLTPAHWLMFLKADRNRVVRVRLCLQRGVLQIVGVSKVLGENCPNRENLPLCIHHPLISRLRVQRGKSSFFFSNDLLYSQQVTSTVKHANHMQVLHVIDSNRKNSELSQQGQQQGLHRLSLQA